MCNGNLAFDSMAQCSSRTGVPMAALKMAKSGGCDAFNHGRVELFGFLKWWFAQTMDDANIDWSKELNKERTLRERIRRAEDEGRALDVDKAGEIADGAMRKVVSTLERVFCGELPPDLKGQDEIAVRAKCREAIDGIKNELAKNIGKITSSKVG